MPLKKNLLINSLLLAITSFYNTSTSAHGTMFSPVSRAYQCYLEGPENTTSAACQAAVATGGKSALYNWSAISQNAGGDDLSFVPDGKLCSGGNESYKGFDLARNDWVKTDIDTNNIDFSFRGTAPHATKRWSYYITKDDYDMNDSLTWNDLEPLCEFGSISLENGMYNMSCSLPENKSGDQIVYSVWERSDSQETFYTCMDVNIINENANSITDNQTDTDPENETETENDSDSNTETELENEDSTNTDTEQPAACADTSFESGALYAFEDLVQHNNRTFSCLISGWCSSNTNWAYEPGVGTYWQEAWLEISNNCENTETSTDIDTDIESPTEEGDSENQLFDVAQIVASHDLLAGSTVTLRLFDTSAGTQSMTDLESFTLEITANRGATHQWPYDLANLVNSQSSYINIGKLIDNNVIAIESKDSNRVFSELENLHVELEINDYIDSNATQIKAEITASLTAVTGNASVTLTAENSAGVDNQDVTYLWSIINGEATITDETKEVTVINFSSQNLKQTVEVQLTISNSTSSDTTTLNIDHDLTDTTSDSSTVAEDKKTITVSGGSVSFLMLLASLFTLTRRFKH